MILIKLILSIEDYDMLLFILFSYSSRINFLLFRAKFIPCSSIFIIIIETISFFHCILRLILLAFKKATDFYILKSGHLLETKYGTSYSSGSEVRKLHLIWLRVPGTNKGHVIK